MNYQFHKCIIIARYTFQELFRSKILWNVVVLSFVLALLTLAAAEFTFGVPTRVALDLGLAFLALSGYGLSFFAGIPLVKNEEESRTIYLIISRPVRRSVFLVGKILGVVAFLALNFGLIAISILGVVSYIGGNLGFIEWAAIGLTFVEVVVLLLLVVLLSLVANRAITLIFGLVILAAGHAVSETLSIKIVQDIPWLRIAVRFYDWILPGFHRFNIKDLILYQTDLPDGYLLKAIIYGLLYSGALLLVSCWIIERKDFD